MDETTPFGIAFGATLGVIAALVTVAGVALFILGVLNAFWSICVKPLLDLYFDWRKRRKESAAVIAKEQMDLEVAEKVLEMRERSESMAARHLGIPNV